MQVLIIILIQLIAFLSLAFTCTWCLSERFKHSQLARSEWSAELLIHRCASVEAARQNLLSALRYLKSHEDLQDRSLKIRQELKRLRAPSCPTKGVLRAKTYSQFNPKLPDNYPNWHYQINAKVRDSL